MFLSEPLIKVFKKKNYTDSSIESIDQALKRLYWIAFAGKSGEYSSYMKIPDKIDPLSKTLPEDLQQSKDKFYKLEKLNPMYIGRRQDDILAAIDKLPASQRQAYLYSVLLIYKELPGLTRKQDVLERYEKVYSQLKNIRQDETVYKAADEKQTANVISNDEYDQVLDKYNRLAEEEPNNKTVALKQLILTLYKYIPPLRPQDYVNTEYKDKSPEAKNYVDVAKKELVLAEGKTMRNKEPRTIKLPDEVISVITRVKALLDSKWLIPMVKDNTRAMSNSAFTHFMQGTISKSGGPDNVGATRLRNLHVSKMQDDNATAEKRKETADIMGHSVNTQQTIYTKHSKSLHKPKEETNISPEDEIAQLKAEVARLKLANTELEKNYAKLLRKLGQ